MGIFTKISDIISANLNDVVEGMEDPEKMLRQAVREMENTIEETRECTAKTMAGKKRMEWELDKNRREVQLWDERARTALADQQEALARKALGRKQEHARLVEALSQEIRETDQAVERLKRQISGMEAKLAEAKRRLVTLSARKRAADLRSKVNEAAEATSSKGNVFAKFDRMREKVEMAEAEADAICELQKSSGSSIEPAVEWPSDTVSPEVEAELARLKKEMQDKSVN